MRNNKKIGEKKEREIGRDRKRQQDIEKENLFQRCTRCTGRPIIARSPTESKQTFISFNIFHLRLHLLSIFLIFNFFFSPFISTHISSWPWYGIVSFQRWPCLFKIGDETVCNNYNVAAFVLLTNIRTAPRWRTVTHAKFTFRMRILARGECISFVRTVNKIDSHSVMHRSRYSNVFTARSTV